MGDNVIFGETMQNQLFLVIPLLFIFSSSGCQAPKEEQSQEQQKDSYIGNQLSAWYAGKEYDDHYLDKVQPIFSKRCVTCHGCYETPCQLDLQSYQGVRRGYNPTPIYNIQRMESMPVTQMNEVYSLSKWRDLGFFPVVANDDELDSTDQVSHWDSSLVNTFIAKGFQYNQPGFLLTDKVEKLYDDVKGSNKTQCTATQAQFQKHFPEENNPWQVVTTEDYFQNTSVDGISSGAGMPFALPALTPQEMTILNTWMRNGAKGPSEKAMKQLQTPNNPAVIDRWEHFFNTDSAQGRQAARYIYEHTYTAYLHFEENPGEYFRIVRTAKMDDNSEGEIITHFPYQLPQEITQFSYRLKKVTDAIVQKKMIVWRVNDKRLARLKALFLGKWPMQPVPEPQYESSNPFAYFAAIPAKIRARFLLENSEVVIGAMVQGAICIGSGATYAIKDHFWVWFLDPDSDISVINPKLGLSSWDILNTGRWSLDEQQMTDKKYTGIFSHLWNQVQGLEFNVKAVKEATEYYQRTSKDDRLYLKAYEYQLRLWLNQQKRKGLKAADIWDGRGDSAYGEGVNPNAWLSITRHERSTTVQRGPEGGAPGSVWVLSFSNFERIYYNLVANYLPSGNLAMKIGSFRIMTYTRLEAEDLAISFLPIKARQAIRRRYAKGIGWIARKLFFPLWSLKSLDSEEGELPPRMAGTEGLDALYAKREQENLAQGMSQTETEDVAAEVSVTYLIDAAKQRLQPVSQMNYNPDAVSKKQKAWEDKFQTTLMHKTQSEDGVRYPEYFPSISYLKINHTQGEPWLYTIIADKAYKYHGIVGTESLTREPTEDKLTLYRGFVGAYPNVFLEINENQSSSFISDIEKIQEKFDWPYFVGKYGISRNSADFWPFFDWIHEWKAKSHPGVEPVMQGIVDVGQYDFFVENQ